MICGEDDSGPFVEPCFFPSVQELTETEVHPAHFARIPSGDTLSTCLGHGG
jgi:hypothetical protein